VTDTTDTTDPIAELAEVAAAALDDYRPVEDMRPVVEAVLDEAAAQRWIAKQLAETGIKAMEIRNGTSDLELKPAAEAVAMWVGIARTMLGDAPNYTETVLDDGPAPEREHDGLYKMEVKVAESGEQFAFILQRVGFGKLTPHEARLKAEGERDTARSLLGKVLRLSEVTHEHRIQGGHDTLGEGLGCAGCALAQQIREHLSGGA
jgi:hypothetical protein